MVTRQKQKYLALMLALSHLALLPASAVNGQFSDGVKLFQKGDYTGASKIFDATIQAGTADANSVYYAAVTHEHLHHYLQAKKLYETVIQNFPEESAADMSIKAMRRPEFQRACDGFSSKYRDTSRDTLPKETYVPFVNNHGAIMVDARINNQPIKMCFDTGASTCVIGLRDANALGIEKPNRPPDLSVNGVGSTEHIPGWKIDIDLAVGRIIRPKFSVFLSTGTLPFPLLGENFYHEFEYSIDKPNSSISFKRNAQTTSAANIQTPTKTVVTVDASGHYEYLVPFTLDGDQLIVVAKINGVDCPVQFDTGATLCLFTSAQLRSVGGGTPTRHFVSIQGAGGSAESAIYNLKSVQLGPLSKPLAVAVSDNARMKYPLLGQNFFGDLHYTIDHPAHVIRFAK